MNGLDALLIIDVQKALIAGAYKEQEVLAAISTAADRIRNRNGVIVYIQHCHSSFEPMMRGSAGWELHDVLDVRDAHTTGNAHLSAQQIIDHHHYALANLAHPKNQIKLALSGEL
jgi:nicotinamidase-related amidase